ncbi:hypothetical protein QQ045_026215 [Rhodiola kirilowii]
MTFSPSYDNLCVIKVQPRNILRKDHGSSKYTLVRDVEDQFGIYDKPLPCFGCGIGCIILYLRSYYRKDPRERAGLAASAVAGMPFTVAAVIMIVVLRYSQPWAIRP